MEKIEIHLSADLQKEIQDVTSYICEGIAKARNLSAPFEVNDAINKVLIAKADALAMVVCRRVEERFKAEVKTAVRKAAIQAVENLIGID